MSAHAQLRLATREAHDRVDARFSALDLGDRDDYAALLAAHARAFVPLEEALTAAGAADLLDDWEEALRAPSLLADLAELGVPPPPPCGAPKFTDESEMIGALYVLEGSRLGGAVLRTSVPTGLPSRFLSHRPPAGHWRRVIAMMERKLYSSAMREAAVRGAMQAFALFD